MPLGLGSNLSRAISKPITPGIVTDNLVLKHQYNTGSVIPVSDGAAFFDGVDDYINCGSDSSIDMGTSAFSVTCWVYFIDLVNSVLVGKGPSLTIADSGWAVSVFGSNGRVYLDINNGGRDATYSNTEAITENKWYHITVVVPASGGAGRKIYINGVENVNTEDHELTDTNDAAIDLYFGNSSTGQNDRDFYGYMCNVGIWKDRVLTEPEIKSIMNKNYAGLTDSEKTNLVSWWNLSADANDSHGSNNGTLS